MPQTMHNPPHPGEILEGLYLEPLGMSNTELAHHLGVDRKTISRVVNGRCGVSVDMALRLAKYFRTTEKYWLELQQNYDIWQATHAKGFDLSHIHQIDTRLYKNLNTG